MRFARTTTVTALVAVLCLLLAGSALADVVRNDVTSTAAGKILSVQAGSNATVTYDIQNTNSQSQQFPDPQTNCNPADSTPLTITPTGLPAGATAPATIANDCRPKTFPIQFSVGASVAPGDYPIGHNLVDNGPGRYFNEADFTLRVTAPPKSAGSVSINNIPNDAVYGGSFTPAFTKAGDGATSVASKSPSVCTVASGDVTFVATGQCTLQASVAEGSTHLAATGPEQMFSVGRRPITVTADDKSKEYGQNDPDLTYDLTTGSLAFSDAFSGALSRQPGESVANSPYAIQQGTLALSDNYALTFVGGKLTITAKSVTGSFTAADKAYDGTTAATVLTRSVNGALDGDDVSLTGGTASFGSASVGANKTVTLSGASLTGADAGNYSLQSVNTATASITAWNAEGYGFHQPVGAANSVFVAAPAAAPAAGNSTVWNTAKGGSTIPLKFNVYAGSVEKTSTSDIKGFTVTKLSNCTSGVGTDEVDMTTTGATSLRYDATAQQFIQNWATPKVSMDTCYRAMVTFADDSTLSGFFRLRR